MRQLRGTELKRFLRQYRKTHPTTKQIVLLLQSVEYPVNVGSVFRIADACNVEEVIIMLSIIRPGSVWWWGTRTTELPARPWPCAMRLSLYPCMARGGR